MSGNIFGKPFRSWVTRQINKRQESLGYVDYGVDDLKYQNTKTPWIRLASTVDISGDDESQVVANLLKNNFPEGTFKNDIAAKNFILQGGVIGIGDGNELKTNQGLNSTNQYYKGAYGWGGINERGYVPLPGLIDANLIYKSDGAFAQAVINMKCFSRSQLALMEVLYMRPGFNLLLEFGWSSYLNSETGKLETYDTFMSNALNFTLNKNGITCEDFENKDGSRYSNILGLIEQERVSRSGNYEGIFGTITNFNWVFNPSDGSYTCQTTIIGHGNVIESLQVNISSPVVKDEFLLNVGRTEDAGIEQANLRNNKLTTFMDNIYRSFVSATDNSTKNSTISSKIGELTLTSANTTYGFQDYTLNDFQSFEKEERGVLTIKNGIVGFTGMSSNVMGLDEQPIQVFIKFSVLLAILQKFFLLYDDDSNPAFFFNMSFFDLDNDQNYIANIPGQFSADPLKCFTVYQNHNIDFGPLSKLMNSFLLKTEIYNTLEASNESFNLPNTTMNTIFRKAAPNFLSDLGHAAKLSDIFINTQYVNQVVTDTNLYNNQTLSLSLLKFLQSLLDGISTSRGGLNNFKVISDITNNQVKIIDESPLIRWKSGVPPTSDGTELCVFNTFGVKNQIGGSIVKNLNVQSKIDQDMVTVIAASTGNRSNGFQSNGTGLGKWNDGLSDRIFPNPGDAPNTSATKEETPTQKISKLWKENINTYNPKDGVSMYRGLFNSIFDDLKWNKVNIESLKSNNSQFQSLLSGILVDSQQVSSPYFLPFSFDMDIEGISGIRLYEHFDLDDNVLPTTYDSSTLELQVKTCDHTVNASEWVTKTSAIPKPVVPPNTPFVEANPMSYENVGGDFKEQEDLASSVSLVTVTSAYPISQIFKTEVTAKTQIYLHHTVSGQNIQAVLNDWSKRSDKVSTHYVTNNNGEAEQVFPDENWANQLGVDAEAFSANSIPYKNLNRTALGIELCSYGPLQFDVASDTFKSIAFPKNTIPKEEVVQPVDKNNNPISYDGVKFYQKYSNSQIENVKNIMLRWMEKYNIPFIYNYKELFPSVHETLYGNLDSYGGISKNALNNIKGVYTHNSVRIDKSDVFPQKELLDMLKSISTSQSGLTPFESSRPFNYSNTTYEYSSTSLRVGETVTATATYTDPSGKEWVGTGKREKEFSRQEYNRIINAAKFSAENSILSQINRS